MLRFLPAGLKIVKKKKKIRNETDDIDMLSVYNNTFPCIDLDLIQTLIQEIFLHRWTRGNKKKCNILHPENAISGPFKAF